MQQYDTSPFHLFRVKVERSLSKNTLRRIIPFSLCWINTTWHVGPPPLSVVCQFNSPSNSTYSKVCVFYFLVLPNVILYYYTTLLYSQVIFILLYCTKLYNIRPPPPPFSRITVQESFYQMSRGFAFFTSSSYLMYLN